MFEGMTYESAQVQLAPGDIVALYLDGITETEDPQGNEFGRAPLARFIASHNTLTAEALLEAVFTAVADFTGNEPPNDDQTLLILKIK